MIIDHISHAGSYMGCNSWIDRILRYIQENQEALAQAEPGPQELPQDMGDIRMKIVEFRTVAGQRRWESHKKHGFVYYMLSGSECTGYADITQMGDPVPTEGKDQIIYHSGTGCRIRVPEGHFTVILPQDVHMSKLADGEEATARKCSFKFPVE